MAMMDRGALASWIERYEQAWRTPGTGHLDGLFAADTTYRPAPFDDPLVGLPAIAVFWDAERAGPDEVFALTYQIVAVDGDTGVVRVEVDYGSPPQRRYRDLWIVTLNADGRCIAFEEWPFFPGQPRAVPSPP
jgi:SnoaL-like domain